MLLCHSQQALRPLKQTFHRKIAVPLPHCLHQGVENTASNSVVGIRMDADFRRQLVRQPETDSVNVLRQAIGILFHNAVEITAISLVYLHCQRI